jgi:hypothetical protein
MNTATARRDAFNAMKTASFALADNCPVTFPIALHGTFVSFDRRGRRVVKFSHKIGGLFDTWEAAQDAIDGAESRKPDSITAGGFISYILMDARNAHVARRVDGWSLRGDGMQVQACTWCGVVAPDGYDCCKGPRLP